MINGVPWGFFFSLEYKGFEIRRPLIPFSICVGNGGSQLSLEKGKGGWLYFRLQLGRGVREEVEISHLLFADDILLFYFLFFLSLSRSTCLHDLGIGLV